MFNRRHDRARTTSGWWWETIKTVVFAVSIALVVRTAAYEPFNIPSGSMKPTLLIGDYLFVAKFAYGYSRYSLPWSVPLFSGRVLGDQPERGDVVVFKWPRDNSTDYIKRVIGLPGDRIQVKEGVVYINGQRVKRARVADGGPSGESHANKGFVQFRETLPNGVSYITFDIGKMDVDETPLYTVPQGHYFMMGDNRDRSSDSRKWGFVPAVNLVGRAEVLFFSTDGSAGWWCPAAEWSVPEFWQRLICLPKFWRWPNAIRYPRLFQAIE